LTAGATVVQAEALGVDPERAKEAMSYIVDAFR
jgi:hypothetical protein